VLASEIGGMAIGIELLAGIHHAWWAIPCALVCWALIWWGSFSFIKKGAALLGLVTLCFAVAAYWLHPPPAPLLAGALPSLPRTSPSHYWFIAVSILGASISPYLFYFYSAAAVEEKWDESYVAANRVTSFVGMSFGSLVSCAVLVCAAGVLFPHHIKVDSYNQAPLVLTEVFGYMGFILFAASLIIACLGAAQEIALQVAYVIAQGLGWNWGKNHRPNQVARFSVAYSVVLLAASLLIAIGIDPLQLTLISVALTSATLPIATVPFLVIMNDTRYLGERANGRLSNIVVLAIVVLAAILAVVTLPLEFIGST
jgi:Mn2+/Fe2+ NRAMP family transporter